MPNGDELEIENGLSSGDYRRMLADTLSQAVHFAEQLADGQSDWRLDATRRLTASIAQAWGVRL